MYEDLFNKNQDALDFLIENTDLTREESKTLLPLSRTQLFSITPLGLAKIMNDYKNKL